jgi:type VI protein secretion system component VasF
MLHDVAQARNQQISSSHWTHKRAERSRWRLVRWSVMAGIAAVLLYCLYVGILHLLEDPLPAIVMTLLVPVSLAPMVAGGSRGGRHP